MGVGVENDESLVEENDSRLEVVEGIGSELVGVEKVKAGAVNCTL